MRWNSFLLATCLLCGLTTTAAGQDAPQPPAPATPAFDSIRVMVERLDLEAEQQLWADGEYLPWPHSADAVAERTRDTLTLTPTTTGG